MKLGRFLWANVVLLVFLVAGCGPSDVDPAAPTPTSALGTGTATYVVQRGSVTKKLEFTGRLSPVEEVPLYFKTSGYVKRVLVQPGDQVEAGDVLAKLEMGGAQDQVALAELDLEVAQTRLAEAEEANEDAVARAELALERAQQELAAAQALLNSRAAATVSARATLEQARETGDERGVEIAQAQYNRAVASQEASRYEVEVQRIAVSQAEAELERLKKGVDTVLGLEVKRAQESLDSLREGSQIVAPVDGEVISLSIYPGRPVEAFRPVIVIADPSAIEVSADLSGDQLEGVAEGQEASIVLNSEPDQAWRGTVRRLPYPYGSGGIMESATGVDGSTRISLEGNIGQLELGDLVRVSIVLEERDDTLWLPSAAIRDFQGRHLVTVQDGGRQRLVDVEIGIESEDRVEILEGLQEGQVVLAP